MKKGILTVLSGPSGAGKGTICSLLKKSFSPLHISVSMTTRLPRPGELEGVHYHFVTEEYFKELVRGEKLLEWAYVYGHYYGTPTEKVQKKITAGIDVLLEIDTQGGLQVKRLYPEAVLIFIVPPSLAELKKRIGNRGTEKGEVLARRLRAAYAEVKQAAEYDFIVINDDIVQATEKVRAIITAAKCRGERFQQFLKEIFLQGEKT